MLISSRPSTISNIAEINNISNSKVDTTDSVPSLSSSSSSVGRNSEQDYLLKSKLIAAEQRIKVSIYIMINNN